jgi:hypothetical protein
MVATAAQIAANRANARRSTGPRTPEGKAISSRNALSHGAYADDDTILVTAADTYLDDFRAHFQPVGVLEEHLVDHLAALASRRQRLQIAMDALLELNERHALIEHLHERYGINIDNGQAMGQPSWQAAMRRYDGHDGPDPRRPDLVSDPALDPDPILCSLAYTLSSPRAATLFRHEASVDRRFHATLKELATLQAQRRDAPATASTTQPAVPLYEPRLQRALDHHLREAAAANPHRDPLAPAAPPSPALNTDALTSDPLPDHATEPVPPPVATAQASQGDQSQSARPAHRPGTPPEQNEPGATYASKEAANAPANTDDRGTAGTMQPDRRIEPNAGTTPRSLGAALAAKLREYGIEPTIAAYLAGDEPVFRSVLPRDPNEPSSIPAHWPGALLPGQ